MMDLQTVYKEQIRPNWSGEGRLGNLLAVPKVVRVVIDMGVGEAASNKEVMADAQTQLAVLTGQKPQLRRARQAIAGFGIRAGDPVGWRVTLRGRRMYTFLEKLFGIVLPRLRDFRGVRRAAFDGRGNYTLGLPDHTIFPEIDTGKIKRAFGLGITLVTTAKTDQDAQLLLTGLGMPFEKEKQ